MMEEWTIQNIFSKCQTRKFWNIFLPKNLANDFPTLTMKHIVLKLHIVSGNIYHNNRRKNRPKTVSS